jgi:GxxExxY protein
MKFDDLSNKVIGYAIDVHRELGPGLLESAYEQCLAHELRLHCIALNSNCNIHNPSIIKVFGLIVGIE